MSINLADLRKTITWRQIEQILLVITVVSAVLSSYFAYQSVQLVLNPATTVQLGNGKITQGNQTSVIYPQFYQTPPITISNYRYAIVHPYYVADTRLAYPNVYRFGPVFTDVIVDGRTSRTYFAQIAWGTGAASVVTGLPNNLTAVTGLSLYTRSYCAGNCTIAGVTIYVQADLVR
jgi:hypothetical protein